MTLSSARYKRDIEGMGTRSPGVHQLRPVTFAYRNDAQGVTHSGLIAEEVAAVYPELVTHTATGEVQAVRYQELIPMLLNELQRQHQELQHQQQELADLRALVGQVRGVEASITVPVPSPVPSIEQLGAPTGALSSDSSSPPPSAGALACRNSDTPCVERGHRRGLGGRGGPARRR